MTTLFTFKKYFEPKTVAECTELLSEYGDKVKMIAGGTDLIPALKHRVCRPEIVIGLTSIGEMNALEETEEGLLIGANVSHMTLSKSNLVNEKWPALAKACGHVSSVEVRNIGTIGGNVCNASPSGDGIQGLIVYGAVVNVQAAEKKRQVPIIDFFVGPGKTVLEKGEVVVSFTLPYPEDNTRATYEKYAIRGNTDITLVGAGASVTLDGDTVSKAVVSLSSVAPTPIRVKESEDYLLGKSLTDETIEKAADIAEESCKPITDQRATKEYRSEMVKVWVKNALKALRD